MLWDGWVTITSSQGFFHVSSIKIDIRLAAEFAQRGHNMIGERSGPLVFTQATFAEKFAGVNGCPNPNPDLRGAKHPGANGVGVAAADHGNGNDRHIGSNSHTGGPGLTPINPAVGRAGALGVNAEKLPSVQNIPGGGEQYSGQAEPDQPRCRTIFAACRRYPGW